MTDNEMLDYSTDAMRSLLELFDNDAQRACNLICDIIAYPDDPDNDDADFRNADELARDALANMQHDPDAIERITAAARIAFDDPTESFHAAHIRDALRDNS